MGWELGTVEWRGEISYKLLVKRSSLNSSRSVLVIIAATSQHCDLEQLNVPLVSTVFCYVINDHKLSGLKQHTNIISQFLWVRGLGIF